MPIDIIPQAKPTANKRKITSISINIDAVYMVIGWEDGYLDAQGKFVSLGSIYNYRITGQDFTQLITKKPSGTKTYYENIRTLLYTYMQSINWGKK